MDKHTTVNITDDLSSISDSDTMTEKSYNIWSKKQNIVQKI